MWPNIQNGAPMQITKLNNTRIPIPNLILTLSPEKYIFPQLYLGRPYFPLTLLFVVKGFNSEKLYKQEEWPAIISQMHFPHAHNLPVILGSLSSWYPNYFTPYQCEISIFLTYCISFIREIFSPLSFCGWSLDILLSFRKLFTPCLFKTGQLKWFSWFSGQSLYQAKADCIGQFCLR